MFGFTDFSLIKCNISKLSIKILIFKELTVKGRPHSIVVNILNCNVVISEFEHLSCLTQSAGAVEYADCISAEG